MVGVNPGSGQVGDLLAGKLGEELSHRPPVASDPPALGEGEV